MTTSDISSIGNYSAINQWGQQQRKQSDEPCRLSTSCTWIKNEWHWSLVHQGLCSPTKRKIGKILEDIGPCADGSIDATVLARIIHEYNKNWHRKALGMTPAKKRAMMPLWTEAHIADDFSDNLNWIQPMRSLPRMSRRLPTQSMCRGRDLTWRVRMQLSRGFPTQNRRVPEDLPLPILTALSSPNVQWHGSSQ